MRANAILPRLLLSAALLAAGCSRPGASEGSPDPSGRPDEAPASVPSSAEVPSHTRGPVLTPEDVEAETEQRITEQNLESELDRLEREIQAE